MELNSLLKISIEKKASDLHLVVGYKPIVRVDGEILALEDCDELSSLETKKMIDSILTIGQKKIFQEAREMDISYEINKLGRFRINLFWEKDNPALVARIINKDIPDLKSLGFGDVVERMIMQKQGLVLVTGPTGCGKSTSLAAMINHINDNKTASIITLEDPIEYLFPKSKSIIVQRELGSDMLSFAEGLKHVLRQDPNIIMVGEMRDLETISSTLTLAETGHMVLATLHTPDASQVIDRIVDVFPSYQQEQVRMQLSMVLTGVIAQQLLPKIGGGMIAAREILINTPAVSNIIRENKIPQIKTVLQTSADRGMITMKQSIKELYENNIITEDTARQFLIED
jgi:twitching motility protein PilT